MISVCRNEKFRHTVFFYARQKHRHHTFSEAKVMHPANAGNTILRSCAQRPPGTSTHAGSAAGHSSAANPTSGKGISHNGSPTTPANLYTASLIVHPLSSRASLVPHADCPSERKRALTRLSCTPRPQLSASTPMAPPRQSMASTARPRQCDTDTDSLRPTRNGAPEASCPSSGTSFPKASSTSILTPSRSTSLRENAATDAPPSG